MSSTSKQAPSELAMIGVDIGKDVFHLYQRSWGLTLRGIPESIEI